MLANAAGCAREIGTKSSAQDLVTEWDTRVEEVICRHLDRLAPEISVVAEESSGEQAAKGDTIAGDRWLVDPIDGTVNFAHGHPVFSVSIALERHGEPVVGVIRAPALGWEGYACSGGGAWAHGDEPLRVSAITSLSQAMLATGFPYDRATSPANNFAEWEHFQRRAGACRRMGSASLDLFMVARGWYDGYWETKLHPWDIAAGALLVREAGGIVTSIDGGPFVADHGNAVASNGAIHKEILDELAAVGGSSWSRR